MIRKLAIAIIGAPLILFAAFFLYEVFDGFLARDFEIKECRKAATTLQQFIDCAHDATP